MKLFGHPLHIMLIHFPSALFPMECMCYGIYYFAGDASFATAAFYSMLGAVTFGWLAIIFGALDLIKIPAEKPEAIKRALIHGGINTTVVLVYSVLVWILMNKYPGLPPATLILFITKISLIIFMVVGNYLGGSLVLKDRIGAE